MKIDSLATMFLFIEGAVGSGKSTALQRLKALGHATVQEPVKLWSKHLEGVYGPNGSSWGLPMQMMALVTRMEEILRNVDLAKKQLVVVERSLDSDRIFAQDLSEEDARIYEEMRARYEKLLDWNDVEVRQVYLRASPKVCMGRVHKRNRPQEKTMTLARMTELHDRHERAFKHLPGVDASRPQDDVVKDLQTLIAGLSVKVIET